MGIDALIAPGSVILNKYRVERVLGKGGMGVVVAARHLELDELFAVKLMLPSLSISPEATERFLREARAAAKLKGDHVAKVQDVGRLDDGTSYMVMEYLVGADLKEVLRKRGTLPVEAAVGYVLQACETLREAHALGIVHRDVKCANIFLADGPKGVPRVKVLDFGISKHTISDAVGLTATNAVAGSPLYMSPEQMRSAKYVDHRTDIWAIGIVLYELLTGATPFHAETITAVAGRVLQDDPVPPSQLRPGIPASIDAVVLRCLAKRPEHRFQAMDELIAVLRGQMQPATAGDETAMGAATIPLPRASGASSPGGEVVAGPSPAASSTTGGFGQVSNAAPAARSGTGILRKQAWLFAAAVLGTVFLAVIAVFIWRSSQVRPIDASGTTTTEAAAGAADDGPRQATAAAMTAAPAPPAPSQAPASSATAPAASAAPDTARSAGVLKPTGRNAGTAPTPAQSGAPTFAAVTPPPGTTTPTVAAAPTISASATPTKKIEPLY